MIAFLEDAGACSNIEEGREDGPSRAGDCQQKEDQQGDLHHFKIASASSSTMIHSSYENLRAEMFFVGRAIACCAWCRVLLLRCSIRGPACNHFCCCSGVRTLCCASFSRTTLTMMGVTTLA